MVLYGACVVLAQEAAHREDYSIETQLLQIVSSLNVFYNLNCNLKNNEDDHSYFISSENISFIHDFLCTSGNYLKKGTIGFIISVSLIDLVDFIQESEASYVQDTIDFLSNYIIVHPSLSRGNYLTNEVTYFQESKNFICKINLKADHPYLLEIKMVCSLDEFDKNILSDATAVLTNEYNNIINLINTTTNEKV